MLAANSSKKLECIVITGYTDFDISAMESSSNMTTACTPTNYILKQLI